MRFAVVILDWNQAEDTREILGVLSRWDRLRPEIFVVDNASSDDEAGTIPLTFPRVRYLRSDTNRGFSGGVNTAFAAMPHNAFDAVLLLNSDARIAEGGVAALLDDLAAQPRLGMVGPALSAAESDPLVSVGGRDIAAFNRTRRMVRRDRLAAMRGPTEVEYVPGTVALIRAEVLSAVGWFDEQYFFSGEVADLCERARGAGFSCAVDPRVEALHPADPSNPLRGTLYLYYTLRNRFLFVRKFRRRAMALRFAWWTCCGLLMAAAAMARLRRPSARAAILAVRDGLLGVYGNRNALFDA